MAVVNSSLALLSILSLMVFGASSSLPPLHTADTLSPSDDSSTFCVPQYSSVSPSLCLTSSERGEKVMRLETSDAHSSSDGIIMVFLTTVFLIALILYGKAVISIMLVLGAMVAIFLFFAVR